MNPTTLLIAEDDPHIHQGLRDLLFSEGYRVLSAYDGQKAWELFQQEKPGLVLLDVMMPELSGFEVCRRIRKQDIHTPILFLTAQNEEMTQVEGFRLGGDDYVTKPFGMQALLARIQRLIRQAHTNAPDASDAVAEEFTFGQSRIHRQRYELACNQQTFSLTARELALLELFHQHPGQVLDRETLLNRIWGLHYAGNTRTLDQHIAQLRKKIEPDPQSPRYLLTVHGIGYRYEPAPPDTNA